MVSVETEEKYPLFLEPPKRLFLTNYFEVHCIFRRVGNIVTRKASIILGVFKAQSEKPQKLLEFKIEKSLNFEVILRLCKLMVYLSGTSIRKNNFASHFKGGVVLLVGVVI